MYIINYNEQMEKSMMPHHSTLKNNVQEYHFFIPELWKGYRLFKYSTGLPYIKTREERHTAAFTKGSILL